MTVLALITARGGSRGLPRKNVLPLAGKPLIAWSIEAARACPVVDRVVLSSEDEEIARIAREWGCEVPFMRPAVLASDTASSMDVILHALDTLECAGAWQARWVVLLQPTSPLRSADDIQACVRLCQEQGRPAVVSVVEASHPPEWMYYLDGPGADQRMRPVLATPPAGRRQDTRTAYQLNGAVYVADVAWLRQTRTFLTPDTGAWVMPAQRSVDIDSALDFTLAEVLITHAA